MSDTAEDYVSTPDVNAGMDAMFTRPPLTFNGQKLFPYGLGEEGLMREALVGVRGDELYALTFLRVLTELQTSFDAYRQDGWGNSKNTKAMSEDDATDAAVADLLKQLHADAELFQAKANRQRRTLKRKGVEEAIKLVNQIVAEAEKTQAIPAEETPDEPGK